MAWKSWNVRVTVHVIWAVCNVIVWCNCAGHFTQEEDSIIYQMQARCCSLSLPFSSPSLSPSLCPSLPLSRILSVFAHACKIVVKVCDIFLRLNAFTNCIFHTKIGLLCIHMFANEDIFVSTATWKNVGCRFCNQNYTNVHSLTNLHVQAWKQMGRHFPSAQRPHRQCRQKPMEFTFTSVAVSYW